MILLRSLLFYLGFAVSLVIHASMCVISGPFMSMPTRYRFFLKWNAICLWWLKVTCGIRHEIHGSENVPPAPFVILSNHQSPWETLFLYHHFLPICAILKRELLNIPFFGWGLRMLRPIAIDRSRKTRALQQLLDQGKARLQEGTSVLVFPEGTRVAAGTVKKFSAGGAELAIASGARILPIAHNAGLYWPSGKLVKHPGTIHMVIGKAIDPAGRSAREVSHEVENWVRQTLSAD